jgi:hypothetical protein
MLTSQVANVFTAHRVHGLKPLSDFLLEIDTPARQRLVLGQFQQQMLVQKPSTNSKISLSIDVDPVIDAMIGSYPSLLLKAMYSSNMLPSSAKLNPRTGSTGSNRCPTSCWKLRGVNFQQEVGQRFEPVDPVRGFNFAELGSMFDEYPSSAKLNPRTGSTGSNRCPTSCWKLTPRRGKGWYSGSFSSKDG